MGLPFVCLSVWDASTLKLFKRIWLKFGGLS